MSAIDRFAEHAHGYTDAYRESAMPGTPRLAVAVVVCMDTRLSPYAILGLKEGDAHVIRNAGGLVTSDVIRSLAASQHLLATRSVMVLQHTRCGLMGITDEEFRERLREHAGAEPDFELGAFTELEASIRRNVELVRASPFLPHRDDVRGFAFDVETGELHEVA